MAVGTDGGWHPLLTPTPRPAKKKSKQEKKKREVECIDFLSSDDEETEEEDDSLVEVVDFNTNTSLEKLKSQKWKVIPSQEKKKREVECIDLLSSDDPLAGEEEGGRMHRPPVQRRGD